MQTPRLNRPIDIQYEHEQGEWKRKSPTALSGFFVLRVNDRELWPIEAGLEHHPPFCRVVVAYLVPAEPLGVAVGEDRGVPERVPGHRSHLGVGDPQLLRIAHVLAEVGP